MFQSNNKYMTIKMISPAFTQTKVIDITYPVEDGADGMLPALLRVSQEAAAACQKGFKLLVLSDRQASKTRVPISSLMALGRIHHHLIEQKLRLKAGLIVETGEARLELIF